MAVAIKVPAVGESITEGIVSRWLKNDGDYVREGEPVLELETDKAATTVPAPGSGVLRTSAKEGDTVQIGAVVGHLDPAPAPAADNNKTPAAKSAAPAAKDQPVILSPAARQLADDKGLDPAAISGTGRGGRVTKEDVVAHLERRSAPPPEPASPSPSLAEVLPFTPPAPAVPTAEPPHETRQRMSAIRQRIAERLVASQQATATLTTFNEADLSAVMALRARYKDRFKEKYDVGLGFMPFFVKASVQALKDYPLVNARIDGQDVVHQHHHHIGVAVSTEKGLMVPVLRHADRMSFADIDKHLAALARKAREGKIDVSDLQGGTFTITNGGVFGSLLSTPILNPPQSAILGMHTIQKRPVAVDDQVVIRPMMYLALSYDHRLIDGREAVLFLIRVKECIENPERLLLEI